MKLMAVAVAVAGAATVYAAQESRRVVTFENSVAIEAKTVKDAPYSAEVVIDHTQTLADGNRIVQHSTGRVYRDREGRVRREEDRDSGGATASIVDPVGGVSYFLDSENHVAWKTPLPADALAAKIEAVRRAAGPPEQRVEVPRGMATLEVNGGRVEKRIPGTGREQRAAEQLASRTIEGVRADGHRVTTTIPAGAIGNDLPIVITSEEWTSPDLKVLVLTERKDPRTGDSSYRLVNINQGEPDASLFQVPAGYTIKENTIRVRRNEER